LDKLCKKYTKKSVISGKLIALALVIPKFFRNIKPIHFINTNSKDIGLGVITGSSIFGKKFILKIKRFYSVFRNSLNFLIILSSETSIIQPKYFIKGNLYICSYINFLNCNTMGLKNKSNRKSDFILFIAYNFNLFVF